MEHTAACSIITHRDFQVGEVGNLFEFENIVSLGLMRSQPSMLTSCYFFFSEIANY